MPPPAIEAKIQLAWDIRCGTGESPVWSDTRDELLFCDIPAGRIHAYGPVSGRRETWKLPGVVASFGLCRSGRLVVAQRDRVILYDLEHDRIVNLTDAVPMPAETRFNDGKVGPDGAFWVGTIDMAKDKHPTSALFRITADGRVEQKAGGYINCNGLAWTSDGARMFHCESRPGFVDTWAFDRATGAISDRRKLIDLASEGRCDGGAADLDGSYWSAAVGGQHLNHIGADGTLLGQLRLPVPSPTMPCFSPHGLFITTLRDGRDSEVADNPTMGGLLLAEIAASGVPAFQFAD